MGGLVFYLETRDTNGINKYSLDNGWNLSTDSWKNETVLLYGNINIYYRVLSTSNIDHFRNLFCIFYQKIDFPQLFLTNCFVNPYHLDRLQFYSAFLKYSIWETLIQIICPLMALKSIWYGWNTADGAQQKRQYINKQTYCIILQIKNADDIGFLGLSFYCTCLIQQPLPQIFLFLCNSVKTYFINGVLKREHQSL